jgi:hypothetical protein
MSKIEVDTIEPQSGTSLTLGASGDTITIPSGATLTNSGTATGFGKVLQVVSTTKTDAFTTTSGSAVDITGMSVSITPSSASNKILVNVSIGTHDLTAAATYGYILKRDSTSIGVGIGGDGTASTMAGTMNADRGEGQSMMFLDTPATTSSTTYKLQAYVNSATLSINDREGNADYSTISTITVMEIAG